MLGHQDEEDISPQNTPPLLKSAAHRFISNHLITYPKEILLMYIGAAPSGQKMNPPMNNRLDRSWAILFARLVLGLIFFMAGVYKVFQLGPLNHARKYFIPFSDTLLPVWSLWVTGVTIPFVELIAGGLVILGFCTRKALVALGFVLAIVTFGHLLKEPLYEFHTHVIPRLALLLFILVLPREDDRFSIDALLNSRSKKTLTSDERMKP
jgi:uncharacterized membrane protein YphA (DoxX/SURF4 family)